MYNDLENTEAIKKKFSKLKELSKKQKSFGKILKNIKNVRDKRMAHHLYDYQPNDGNLLSISVSQDFDNLIQWIIAVIETGSTLVRRTRNLSSEPLVRAVFYSKCIIKIVGRPSPVVESDQLLRAQHACGFNREQDSSREVVKKQNSLRVPVGVTFRPSEKVYPEPRTIEESLFEYLDDCERRRREMVS